MATKVSNPYNFNIKDDYNSYADIIINDPYMYKFYWGMGEDTFSPWGFDKVGVLDEYLYSQASDSTGLVPDNINGTEVMAIVTRRRDASRLYFKNGAEPYPVVSIHQYPAYLDIKNKLVTGMLLYPNEAEGIPGKVYISKDQTFKMSFGDLNYYPLFIYGYDGQFGPIPDENGLVNLSDYKDNYIGSYSIIDVIPQDNLAYLKSGLIADSDMSGMFSNALIIAYIPKLEINTSNVTNMSSLFSYCTKLTSLDLSDFNTSKVTNMWWMFAYCQSLTSLDLSSFDTSKVINMSGMFHYCKSLTSLNLSHFDTSNVTNMSDMFRDCKSLTSLDLSNFDTSKVTDMSGMFKGCEQLNNFKGVLDLSSCTDASFMFDNCSSNANIHLKNVRSSYFSNVGGGMGHQYIVDNWLD